MIASRLQLERSSRHPEPHGQASAYGNRLRSAMLAIIAILLVEVIAISLAPGAAYAAKANVKYVDNPKTAIKGGDIDVWMNDFTDYEVLSKTNLTYDSSSKTYQNVKNKKTTTIKIKYYGAGVMDNNEKVDVVLDLSTTRDAAPTWTADYFKPGNNSLSCIGWKEKTTVEVRLYKAGTSTRLTGKKFAIYFTDLDQPSKGSYKFEGEWTEGIELVSNYVNTIYSGKKSSKHPAIGSGELNKHPWVHATHDCENCKATWVSFIAKDGLKYIYRGCGCTTHVPLPKIAPPKITVKYNVNGGSIAGPSTNATYNFRVVSSLVQRTKKAVSDYSDLATTVKRPETYHDLSNICDQGNSYIRRTGYTNGSGAQYYYALNGSQRVYFHADDSAANTSNKVTTKTLNFETQITEDKTVTLYVNWVPNTYNISYTGMDGASFGTNHPTTATYDREFAVDNPTKQYYDFIGWKITGMDTTTHVINGAGTTASTTTTSATKYKNLRATGGTVNFEAQWKPKEYYVAYDGNGATSGTMERSIHQIGVSKKLSKNAFTRATSECEYEFIGWSRTQDGSVDFDDEQEVLDLTDKGGETVTLYALWKPLTKVELYVDDLTTPKWVETYRNEDQAWDVPADRTAQAQKPNCTNLDGSPGLEAWFTGPDFGEKFTARTLPYGTVKLYARNWATVRYIHGGDCDQATTYTPPDGASGSISVAAVTPADFSAAWGTTVNLGEVGNRRLSYDGSAAFPLTIRARLGWFLDEGGGGTALTALAVDHDYNVYKIWDKSTYDGYLGNG